MRFGDICLACVWVTLTLSTQKQSAPATPQYYDEPTFIVAGVADPSQRGGHGSDPVLRSSEALTKATASLRTEASATLSEEALRQAIAREPNRADLHHSLAAVEEKRGNALEAVREYQRAAELEPSEATLFDWGTELLRHSADDQAIEVFTRSTRLFPRSTRTLLGLAVALYSRGSYNDAVQRFFEATDLNPSDPEPYLFLGKVSRAPIMESTGFDERMERFARLCPENSWANYYYAVSLWKIGNAARAQSLLERAIRLDPHFGLAYLQLGIIFADQDKPLKAISAYQSAIESSPTMEEAHYRLAQAYRKAGDQAKAQKELEIYQQLSREAAQQLERERAEIQQFVFELRGR